MSRPTSRQLSLTEELEKLEQATTLTLQEIDANFSKAHRIVTNSILPVVEQYGEHSRSVWEASKFWKQFFESSANCSLSNYEEAASDAADAEETGATEQFEGETSLAEGETTTDSIVTAREQSTLGDDADTPRPRRHLQHHHNVTGDDTLLANDDVSGSTPRPPARKSISSRTAQFADLGSPYEDLRRELQGAPEEEFEVDYTLSSVEDEENEGATQVLDDSDADESALLAARTRRLPDWSMTPKGQTSTVKKSGTGISGAPGSKDPLLHRVLDKNYRIQATPMRGRYSPLKQDRRYGDPLAEEADEEPKNAWDSPVSSPDLAAPTLRSAAFMSPIKAAKLAGMSAPLMTTGGPRTPGVSVHTPIGKRGRDVFASARRVAGNDNNETKELGRPIPGRDDGPATAGKGKGKERDEIDWDSDEDDDLYGGFSPPKTMHFALPKSRLLQTPAKEASKRIVEDILFTAGVEPGDTSEFSPSLVKMRGDILDDSF